jgi:hypothetical protein
VQAADGVALGDYLYFKIIGKGPSLDAWDGMSWRADQEGRENARQTPNVVYGQSFTYGEQEKETLAALALPETGTGDPRTRDSRKIREPNKQPKALVAGDIWSISSRIPHRLLSSVVALRFPERASGNLRENV